MVLLAPAVVFPGRDVTGEIAGTVPRLHNADDPAGHLVHMALQPYPEHPRCGRVPCVARLHQQLASGWKRADCGYGSRWRGTVPYDRSCLRGPDDQGIE